MKEDVEKFVPAKKEAPKAAAAAAAPAAAAPASSEYTDVPVSSMRKIIGKRLLESTQSIPSFYVTVEVNMGKSSFSPSFSFVRARRVRSRS